MNETEKFEFGLWLLELLMKPDRSGPIQYGDLADLYLTGRGLHFDKYPEALRTTEACPYWEKVERKKSNLTFFIRGELPAMLGVITDVNGTPVSLNETYLTAYGKKTSMKDRKKFSPTIGDSTIRGASVKLFEPTDGVLGVAEGIETALAAHKLSGLPTWATLSAVGMQNLELPPGLRELHIFADNDENLTGQKAADILRQRANAKGILVKVLTPPKVKQDFNDILLEVSNNG